MSDEEMTLNAGEHGESPLSSAGPSTPSTEAPISKNALKRAAKMARREEFKLVKRVQEKARRRERQHALSEGYAAGTLSAEDKALVERQRELKRARKASARQDAAAFPAGVLIDLEFDDLMTDQEITSIHSQLGFVYSNNRTAQHPFSAVMYSGFSPESAPRLWAKLGKANWPRWHRQYFYREDVGTLAKSLAGRVTPKEVDAAPVEPLVATSIPDSTTTPYEEFVSALAGPNLPDSIPSTHKLVYLSADAEEELSTLAEDEVYIIGGIVDRNRHKMLCQNKAERLGIRTARLPIGTYLANLPTRKVLTVNQVFDILLQYVALRDWAAAFEAVIPQRKYFAGKAEKKAANKADGSEGVEDGHGAEVSDVPQLAA